MQKYLYTQANGEEVIAFLKANEVEAKLIGHLPSNHDIDILIEKVTYPTKTPRHRVFVVLGVADRPETIVKSDLGSYCCKTRWGIIEVFFKAPDETYDYMENLNKSALTSQQIRDRLEQLSQKRFDAGQSRQLSTIHSKTIQKGVQSIYEDRKKELSDFKSTEWVEKEYALVSVREWKNYALTLESKLANDEMKK